MKRTRTAARYVFWRGSTLAIALLSNLITVFPGVTQDQFPPNPLEITEPDPLVPRLAVDRPLSSQEQGVLSAATDQLQRQAETKLAAGDVPGAFEIWNRVLRLRRVLGTEQEVDSLSQVGAVAWKESQTTEVRLITQRLQQIEQDTKAQTPVNYDLLLKIAQAYQAMRAIDPALATYQQILAHARQQQDVAKEMQTLQAMGELHLAWFDYTSAAATYQELLTLAQSQQDDLAQVTYLQQLAYIYQQNNQPEPAIATQQQLAQVYEHSQQYAAIPPVKLAMGDSYRALNRPDQAASSYQEAFAVSRSTQQYAYATEALQRLADLYRSLNRPNDALMVYQLLIDVQQQAYNTYGLMETYDQIGQLYRTNGNTAQALAAFRRGLALAQQLNYKVSYFTTQIQQIGQP
jgi:tetratricopeptide (TPR) repeat protein